MSEKQPEKAEEKTPNGATRRELFQIGNVLALPVLLGGVQAKAAGLLKPGPGIYESIGVEPVPKEIATTLLGLEHWSRQKSTLLGGRRAVLTPATWHRPVTGLTLEHF